MEIFTIFASIIGVLGTVGTFYYGFRAKDLRRERVSFGWDDIETGTIDLLKAVERCFHPDALLITSGPPAIVGSIAMVQSGRFLPTYLGVQEDKRGYQFNNPLPNHKIISTEKFNIHIPESIFLDTSKKLLILQDCVISGDSLAGIVNMLIAGGYPRGNIHTAALVCSQIARDSNKAPDHYWFPSPYSEFYFPWGKWY